MLHCGRFYWFSPSIKGAATFKSKNPGIILAVRPIFDFLSGFWAVGLPVFLEQPQILFAKSSFSTDLLESRLGIKASKPPLVGFSQH